MRRFLLAAALLLPVTARAGSLGAGSSLATTPAMLSQVLGPKVLPRLWQTQMPFWGLSHAVAPTNNSPLTIGEDFSVDGPFTAFRLILANPGAAQQLGAIRASVSASNASVTTPMDGSGNPLSWLTVTVGGVSNPTLPAATVIGSTNGQPSLTLTDIIPAESLTRTDGGKFALVYTRLLGPSSGNMDVGQIYGTSGTAATLAQYALDSGGRKVSTYYAGGDFVSAPAVQPLLTDSNAQLNSPYAYVAGVQYLSPTRQVTIMGCGDSLTAGFVTTSGYDGFGLQAAVALAKQTGIGVSYLAHGYPGQSTSDIAANCKTAISLLQPQVVTVPIDSPNDYTGVTQGSSAVATTRTAAETNMLGAMDAALASKAVVIGLTPIPFGVYDASNQYGASRAISGAYARMLTGRGVMLVDPQQILLGSVPTATNLPTLPAACLASDGAHLTDACQGKIAAPIVSALAQLF
jgi:hypothetical protein